MECEESICHDYLVLSLDICIHETLFETGLSVREKCGWLPAAQSDAKWQKIKEKNWKIFKALLRFPNSPVARRGALRGFTLPRRSNLKSQQQRCRSTIIGVATDPWARIALHSSHHSRTVRFAFACLRQRHRPTPSLSSPEAPRRGPRADEGDEQDGGGSAARRGAALVVVEERRWRPRPSPSSPSSTSGSFPPLPAARISVTRWLVYAVSGDFLFLAEFLLETSARVFGDILGFRGDLDRGRDIAEFGQCSAEISAFLTWWITFVFKMFELWSCDACRIWGEAKLSIIFSIIVQMNC